MSILTHPTDQATRNRAFNCRMRNRHYEEVYYAFRALKPIINQQNLEADRKAWFAAIGVKINRCEASLETCLEYAQAAIFFGKSEKINLFSKDKRWGILQEEILWSIFSSNCNPQCAIFSLASKQTKCFKVWINQFNHKQMKFMNLDSYPIFKKI